MTQHHAHRPRRRYAALAACVALLAATAACSSSGGQKPDTSPSGGSATAGSGSAASEGPNASGVADLMASVSQRPTGLPQGLTPLPSKPPAGKKVVMLNDGLKQVQSYADGISAACAALGWQFQSISIDDSNPATVLSGATSAIDGGANVLVIVSQQQTTRDRILSMAKAKNVLVVDAISSNTAASGVVLVAKADHEGVHNGQLGMAAMIQDAAASGIKSIHLGYIYIAQFATSVEPVESGLKEVMQQNCRGCTLTRVPMTYPQLLNGTADQVVGSFLQAHPDINYLYYFSSNIADGLAKQLKGAGLKVPRIFGAYPDTSNLADLSNGNASGWLAYPFQVLGWCWTDAIARYFSGADPGIWNSVYEPQWLITKANIGDVTNTDDVEFPTDYASAFKSLWGVG